MHLRIILGRITGVLFVICVALGALAVVAGIVLSAVVLIRYETFDPLVEPATALLFAGVATFLCGFIFGLSSLTFDENGIAGRFIQYIVSRVG